MYSYFGSQRLQRLVPDSRRISGPTECAKAVNNVSFDVRRGLTTALIGESGAAKPPLPEAFSSFATAGKNHGFCALKWKGLRQLERSRSLDEVYYPQKCG